MKTVIIRCLVFLLTGCTCVFATSVRLQEVSGDVMLSFSTETGMQYSVEYTTNLLSAGWDVQEKIIIGDGVDVLVSNTFESAASMFFRVQSMPDITSGLLAHYKLDGNAADSSTNGNNGLAVGVEYITNRLGVANSACLFNGSDSIEIPDSDSTRITGPVSFTVWIRPDQLGSTQMVIGKSDFSSSTDYIVRITAFGGLQWEYNQCFTTSNGTISASAWTHVAVMAESSTVGARRTIYINGIETAHTVSGGANQTEVSNPAMIGAARYWSAPWHEQYAGAIDDLRIYDRELTAAEVQAIYLNTK